MKTLIALVFITVLSFSMADERNLAQSIANIHEKQTSTVGTVDLGDECEHGSFMSGLLYHVRDEEKKKAVVKPPIVAGYDCPSADIGKGCHCPKECLYPNPHNCYSFIQCTDYGVAYLMPCPKGTAWNDNNKICDAPRRSTCRRDTGADATDYVRLILGMTETPVQIDE